MNVEHFLARLLTEDDLERLIERATAEEREVLATIDVEALKLARRSYARKRNAKRARVV
jgi:predicted amidohydrolase